MGRNNRKEKGMVLIVFNIFVFFIMFMTWEMMNLSSEMKDTTTQWVTLENVVADDISFKFDGFAPRTGNKTLYAFRLDRKLHYTYKGQDYTRDDSISYTNSDKNYTRELRHHYTDDYVYKIDPNNPAHFSKTYSALDDDGMKRLGLVGKVVMAIFVLVLIIADIVILRRGKKKKIEIQ